MNDKGTNPFYTGIAADPVLKAPGVENQIDMNKEEELRSRRTGTLPDPLTKINPMLADVFSSMVNIKALTTQASNNPGIDANNLQVVQDKIDDINALILDLPKYLAIISL